MRYLLAAVLLLFPLTAAYAVDGTLAVTPGSGVTIVTSPDGSGNVLTHSIECDRTTPTQCQNINSSGQAAIQAPPTLPLPAGAATAANQEVTAAGTTASSAQAVQGVTGGVALPVSLAGTQAINNAQVNGVTLSTGAGAVGTGTQRVAVGQDTTTVAGSAPGTAGTPSTNVVSVQGVASGTTIPVSQATGSNLHVVADTGSTTAVTGNVTAVQATGSNLHIVCDSGCSSSTAPADEAAFTAGTTSQTPVGGFFQTTATSNPLTTGQMGAVQLTANRAVFSNLRNASGTEVGTAATPVQVSLANTASNGTAVAVSLSGNQAVNTAQVNGVTTLAGAGAVGTGSQRVAVGQDTTTIAGSAPGTAGTPSTNVLTVQGAASMTALAESVADGSDVTLGAKADSVCGTATGTCSLQALTKFVAAAVSGAIPAGTNTIGAVSQGNGDPCSSVTHVFTPINIAAAANTKIVTGTSSKKTYVCHLFIFAAAADNVGIVEGTGTNCATGTAGVIGGATAAAGINLAVNQGFESGSGTNAIAATATAADDFCFITSAASQLSGVIVTVQQ